MSNKSLFLLRHAKAASSTDLLADQDRPLTDRGVKDAKKLGDRMHKKSYSFDLILSSPAIRAITTAQLVANRLGHKQKFLAVEKSIYLCDMETLIDVVANIPKKIDAVLLVGHNPGLSDLACFLAGEPISMPTCALLELVFEMKTWDQISPNSLSKMHLVN